MKPGLYLIILSRHSKTREELARDLETMRDEFSDLVVLGYDMSQLTTFNKDAQLVVVDLEKWMPSDELVLSELRTAGYNGPVIVLTKRLNESASADYAAEKIIFFDRSKGNQELSGIARRMLVGSLIAARKHPRHPTDESAEVQVAGNPKFFACKVRNMSKGGAFLELDTACALHVGDLLTVKIRLAQVNRIYTVRARVAWVKMPGFGVQFQGEIT
jgi:hypothetical protein